VVTRSARDTLPDWSPTADRIAFARVKSPETILPTGSAFSSPRLALAVANVPGA
jgi:hypothetical protein